MDFSTDNNNNTSGEKSYSLRPRALSKKDEEDLEEEEPVKPRGRTRRRQKQKSAPLSKYRRKTANARERSRMREINDAFEALRKAIPHLASNCDNSEKVSKIMTLRLAMKYITALTNALDNPESYALNFQTTLSLMDNSSTTSSLSDNLVWNEELLPSTPLMETTSTNQIFCMERNINSSESVLQEPPSAQVTRDTFSNIFSRSSEPTVTSIERPSPPPYQYLDPGPPHLNRYTLTPPDDPVHLASNLQVTLGSATTDFQNTTSSMFIPSEFDGLPSPVMDFCDLFIT